MESNSKFTVGKIDAGVAILIDDDLHSVDFPALLLPQGTEEGCVLNITVSRNVDEEKRYRGSYFFKLI